MRHRGALAAGLITLLILLTIVGGSLTNHGLALARGLPDWLAVLGLVGVISMAIAAWVVSVQWPAVAVGLAVAALGLLVPLWATWDWLPRGAQPGLLAASPLMLAGVAQSGLRWRRDDGQLVLGLVYLLAVAAVFVLLVAYDPFAEPACPVTCVHVDPIARGMLSTQGAVGTTAVLMATAGLIGIVALLRGARRIPTPIAFGVVAAMTLIPGAWAVRWAGWDKALPDVLLVLPYPVSAIITGASVLAGYMAVRRTRAIADRLVARLSDPEAAVRNLEGGVGAIEFAIPGEGRWVDRAGRPAPMRGDENGLVVFSDDAGPLLRLLVPADARRSDLLELASPATRLALENARLAAVVKARLADVQESRRRIVAASDAERQRIERDLHDGAQQRLVSASLHISLARTGWAEDETALSRSQNLILDALEELRQLAHGIYPGILLSEGLRVALEELVRGADVPSTLEMHDVDIGNEAATAAYAMVAALLSHAQAAGAPSVRIMATVRDQRLIVKAEIAGHAGIDHWNPLDVADRVGAAGGELTSLAQETRMLVTAELPCASS